MFKRVLLVLVALVAVQSVLFPPEAMCEEQAKKKPWQGTFADGTVLAEEELRKIIKDHDEWLRTKEKKGERAVLIGADLRGFYLADVDLSKAYLVDVDLPGAFLVKAKLRETDLLWADFKGADLSGAILSGAQIKQAWLNGAHLRIADLTGADLRESNFSGADLTGADLSGANLKGAILKDAILSEAIVIEANYEPSPEDLPAVRSIAQAYGLWLMCYRNDPSALVRLRKELRDAGYISQARQIRHVLKHNQGGVSWHSYVTFWLLEWPTGWGESPLKPLLIVVFLLLIFPLFYLAGFTDAQPKGIALQYPTIPNLRKTGSYWECLWRSYYFSLQMATHICWKKISSGTWMTRMQPTDTVMVPKGWYRAVAGIQNVISNYLVALFLLTYFGGLFKD